MNDVSVIVCVRNSAGVLTACLESVVENGAAELLVVDGDSTDGSVDVALRFTDIVLHDEGRGLAYARNLGLSAATRGHVAFVGPDNVLPIGTLDAMLDTRNREGWDGVSAQTRMAEPTGWLARSMDRYKALRFTTGERTVIGTPTLFPTDVLRAFMFDPTLTSSDDADLCERMIAAGRRLGISSAVVYESGTESLQSVLKRWRWYGESDAQFYAKYSPTWSTSRKIRSMLHPVVSELVQPGAGAIQRGEITLLPFLLLITATRYVGWLEQLFRGRRR